MSNEPTGGEAAAPDLLDALAEIAAAVQILSPDRLHFNGQPLGVQPGVPTSLYPTANPLVTLLRDQIYQHAFVKPLRLAPAAAPPAEPGFAARLSQANASRERWEAGWSAVQLFPNGQVAAERHGCRRTLWPGEFLLRDGPGMALRPQAALSVFQPRESHGMQTGFYFAFGEAIADELDESRLLRWYWNVSATGALALLERLTRRLNRFGMPFKFKCLNAAEHFVRLDAAVLYIHRRYYRLVHELLDDILLGLGPEHLGASTPLFTRAVRPGVAIAEDPSGGESFGMHRCRVVAEGLWNAWCAGQAAPDQRLQRIVAQFEGYGLSMARPHLNPGSRFAEA